MKRYILFLISICVTLFATAQMQITGKVTTSNGIPIENVQVQLEDSNQHTLTNTDGEFIFSSLKKGSNLLFSKNGFQNKTVQIEKNNISIILNRVKENYFGLSLEALTQVKVVTGTKKIVSAATAPATIMVITKDQIRTRGYRELDDALRDVPGFDMTRVHGVFPTIRTMRGSYGDENKRILLMIDGIVENQLIGSWELGGPIYSLHNVERIEIIWGPASALYGANAFSGIINLISKSPEQEQSLSYQKGFGSFNTKYDNFALNTRKDNISLSLSGTLYNTDGPKFTNRHPYFADAYVDDAYSFNGRITFNTKKLKSTFGTNIYHLPSGDGTFGMTATKLLSLPSPGNQNEGNLGWIPSNFNNQKPSLWHSYTETFFVEEDWSVNNNLNLLMKMHYRETGLDEDTYSYRQYSANLPYVRKNRLAHVSYQYASEIQADYRFNDAHSLVSGIQYTCTDLEKGYRKTTNDTVLATIDNLLVNQLTSQFLPRQNTIQHNIALYTEYMMVTNWLRNTSFTLGVRYDYNSVYGKTFNPRLGIVSKPNEQLVLKALYGRAFRAPTNFEIYSGFPRVRINNESLKPERIRTYEFNVSYKFKKLFVQANTFYNRLSNLIVASVPIGNGLTQNQNRGSANIYGAELWAKLDLSENIDAFANFCYQHAEQTDLDHTYTIPNIADFKANAGIHFHVTQVFSIDIIQNWIGKRKVISSNPLGELPGYFTTNLSLTSNRFCNDMLSFNFRVDNVFNKEYFDPGIRSADGKGLYSTVHEQPGRSVYLSLMINLRK
ncbi:TonB-dependent receptor [Prolixibacteraceae bacterium JC049]|nr:TonB-dependent receptor [Prolixibacteraceae bacterium JC049]